MTDFDTLVKSFPSNSLKFVDGKNNKHSILAFTLSTCQWCKKGKQWLNDNKFQYSYLDIDLISLEEKQRIKTALFELFKAHMSYPFLVVDGVSIYSGYEPEEWSKLLN